MSDPDTPDSSDEDTIPTFEQNYLFQSFESNPRPILVIDVKTREISRINQKAKEHFGELEEGVKCFEYTHHEEDQCDGDDHRCPIDEVLETKKPVVLEHIHCKKCDDEVIIQINAVPIFDADGEITHIIEYSSDVTKQSKVADQLIESEEKYRMIAENTVDVIFIMDLNMHITYISPNIVKNNGYTPEEVTQQQIRDMLTDESAQIAIDTLQGIKDSDGKGEIDPEHTWTLELEVKKKDGSTYIAEMTFSLIRDDDGQIISLLGVSRDITERRKLQEQVVHMQRQESIGELAAGIAHDFNNLLTVMSGHGELAVDELGKEDPVIADVIADIEEILAAVLKAASLTSQILAYSRKQMLSPKIINLNYTVIGINKLLNRLLGENIFIESSFEDDIWNVYADESKIQLIIMNLATNAKDAMSGGGKLKIKTENKLVSELDVSQRPDAQSGKYVCISVVDEGCGIKTDELHKIFEPFYTTKDVGNGTGLGLSMAYGTVKQHGGWVDVKSEVGKGTTFEIYLPAIDQEEDIEEKEQAELNVELFGKGKRMLIVEDDAAVRELLKKLMLRCGFDVEVALSVKEGEEIFDRENGEFDIVFSDVVLTDRNKTGFDLITKLQGKKNNLKAILASGYVDIEEKWPRINKSGIPFIQKPFNVRELIELIKKVVTS